RAHRTPARARAALRAAGLRQADLGQRGRALGLPAAGHSSVGDRIIRFRGWSHRGTNHHPMKLKNLLPVDAVSDARFAALGPGGRGAAGGAVSRGRLSGAIGGAKDGGLGFVAPALAAGAAAIMAERVPPLPLPEGVAFVRVGNARRALALAAAKFFP